MSLTTPIRVAELREGMLVDLEGDEYATRQPMRDELLGPETPTEHEDARQAHELTVSGFAHEYAEVVTVEHETTGCVRVDFDMISVGFPPHHVLPVVSETLRAGQREPGMADLIDDPALTAQGRQTLVEHAEMVGEPHTREESE